LSRQNLDQTAIGGDPVFQEKLDGSVAKNAESKLFRAQPFEIPRNAQGNVFENLEARKIVQSYQWGERPEICRIGVFDAKQGNSKHLFGGYGPPLPPLRGKVAFAPAKAG
jgi:hypothetical protein